MQYEDVSQKTRRLKEKFVMFFLFCFRCAVFCRDCHAKEGAVHILKRDFCNKLTFYTKRYS